MSVLVSRCNKRRLSRRAVEAKKKAVQRIAEQLMKLEVQATDREENKQIALGTSKLNYLDPRISVAWWEPWIPAKPLDLRSSSSRWPLNPPRPFLPVCLSGVRSGAFPWRRSTTKPSVRSSPGPSTWQTMTMNFKLRFVVLTEKKKDPFFYWMFFSLIEFFARWPDQEIQTIWAETSSRVTRLRWGIKAELHPQQRQSFGNWKTVFLKTFSLSWTNLMAPETFELCGPVAIVYRKKKYEDALYHFSSHLLFHFSPSVYY